LACAADRRPNVLIALKTIIGFEDFTVCGDVPKILKGKEILKASMETVRMERDLFPNPGVSESNVQLQGVLLSQPVIKPLGLFDSGLHDLWLEVYPNSWKKYTADIQTRGVTSVPFSAALLGLPLQAEATALADVPFFDGKWYELFLKVMDEID
jgi:hypothetical protein